MIKDADNGSKQIVNKRTIIWSEAKSNGRKTSQWAWAKPKIWQAGTSPNDGKGDGFYFCIRDVVGTGGGWEEAYLNEGPKVCLLKREGKSA